MTFEEAKQEFEIRYYYWAISEWEKEVNKSFPSLNLFKTESARIVAQFMQQLNSAEQLILARSLLKRFHQKAVKMLGEDISDEEESLVSKFDAFRLAEDAKIISKNLFSKNVKFANKGKFRRTILTKFKAAFGTHCFELELVGLDPELDFKMHYGGWVLNTRFEFNGAHKQIHYWHGIASPNTIEPHRMPTMVMGKSISFNAWLAISSQTQWEYLLPEDVEPACDAAIKFCGRFIEIAPKLLKGLEFEKIKSE
ncbi:MAG TPA: hypothetical protein VHG71_02555 [Verrucomicrobiae bacterium]|nr:hypothetical protein [Verrucomicrobiae bacterium]